MKQLKLFFYLTVSILFFIQQSAAKSEFLLSSTAQEIDVGDQVAGSLAADNIKLYENAGFMNYVKLNSSITLQWCYLEFNNITFELNLHSSKAATSSSTYSSRLDLELFDGLASLGQGLCGFTFTNVTKRLNFGIWELFAENTEGIVFQGRFNVSVVSKIREEELHTRRVLNLGDPYTISCGTPFVTQFCHVFNPAGELVQTKNCQYNGVTFKMDDIGVWKCYAESTESTETIEFTIELVNKDNTVTTWVNETENYVNIGCKLDGYNNTLDISSCKMVTPKHQVLVLRPSSFTDRYLATGTDYKNAICSMQIRKPLKEFEKGAWRCEIVIGRDVTGGFLAVDKTEIEYPKQLKVTTQLGKPFTVSCTVPYSSDYCSIRAPSGTQYLTGLDFVPRLGRCSLDVNNAVQSDSGNWICSFAQKTGIPDDKIIVEVSIAENLIHDNIIFVTAGTPTKLTCSSSGLPLKYCRFMDPHGKTYHIHNHENSISISYYGRGLEYGDCGIEIANTQRTDEGYWTCITQISGSTTHGEISGQIYLSVSATNGENYQTKRIGTAAAEKQNKVVYKLKQEGIQQ